MSYEALWYRHHSEDGQPPRMRRLNRCSAEDQWNAAVDLAAAFCSGEAGYRPSHRSVSVGGMTIVEYYYYWPNRLNESGDTGWWLIPQRVVDRVNALIRAALKCESDLALRQGTLGVSDHAVACRLRIWQRSGQWRRYVRGRRSSESLQRKKTLESGYKRWYQHTFEPQQRGRRRRQTRQATLRESEANEGNVTEQSDAKTGARMIERYMWHITLLSGHVRRSWRNEVTEEALEAAEGMLGAAVAGGQDIPIPGIHGYYLRGEASEDTLKLMVVSGALGEPILTIGVAREGGQVLWRQLVESGQLPVKSSVHRCPPAPWVAARLEPAISDISASEPEVIGMLGDLERCLGWAWIYYKGDSGG